MNSASTKNALLPDDEHDDAREDVREDACPPAVDGAKPRRLSAENGVVPADDHRWMVRVSLFVIAVAVVGTIVAHMGRVLEPLVIAVFLYFIVDAIAVWLERYGAPKWLSYTVLLGGAMVLFVVVAQITVRNLAELAEPKVLEAYEEKAVALGERVATGMGETVRSWAKSAEHEITQQAPGRIAEVTEFGLMMFFYLIFILLNAPRLPQRVRRAYPDRAGQIMGASATISHRLQRYMSVKTVVSIGLGVTSAIALALLRVDYWALWGVLFFLLNYITYVGSIVACVPPAALALLQHDVVWGLVVAAVLIGIRFVWIDVVELRMSGHELNIDPLLLLLATAFWGWVWGAPGLVLAVPMMTALKVILENIEGTRHWAIMMSER